METITPSNSWNDPWRVQTVHMMMVWWRWWYSSSSILFRRWRRLRPSSTSIYLVIHNQVSPLRQTMRYATYHIAHTYVLVARTLEYILSTTHTMLCTRMCGHVWMGYEHQNTRTLEFIWYRTLRRKNGDGQINRCKLATQIGNRSPYSERWFWCVRLWDTDFLNLDMGTDRYINLYFWVIRLLQT